MGIITALSATALSAGLALTGVNAASASSSITLPPGGVLEARVTRFCERVPNLLERADRAKVRLSGDADTKGSLAWLNDRRATAEKNGNRRAVRRIGNRIERRQDRLEQLPTITGKLTRAKQECATLDLPAPAASGSGSLTAPLVRVGRLVVAGLLLAGALGGCGLRDDPAWPPPRPARPPPRRARRPARHEYRDGPGLSMTSSVLPRPRPGRADAVRRRARARRRRLRPDRSRSGHGLELRREDVAPYRVHRR